MKFKADVKFEETSDVLEVSQRHETVAKAKELLMQAIELIAQIDNITPQELLSEVDAGHTETHEEVFADVDDTIEASEEVFAEVDDAIEVPDEVFHVDEVDE